MARMQAYYAKFEENEIKFSPPATTEMAQVCPIRFYKGSTIILYYSESKIEVEQLYPQNCGVIREGNIIILYDGEADKAEKYANAFEELHGWRPLAHRIIGGFKEFYVDPAKGMAFEIADRRIDYLFNGVR